VTIIILDDCRDLPDFVHSVSETDLDSMRRELEGCREHWLVKMTLGVGMIIETSIRLRSGTTSNDE